MSSIHTPTVAAPVTNKDELQSQDAFTQLYQSLTPMMGMVTPQQDSAAMFDEWLKQDILSECSVTSSPEINTPLDQFLMSPQLFHCKDTLTSSEIKIETETESIPQDTTTATATTTTVTTPTLSNYDLDVSAILDSPVTTSYPLTTSQVPTPVATPSVQMSNLFADIGDSLPAALAALAAVASGSPVTPVEMPSPVTSASTPAFSASPPRSRKRASDITPGDEAAVKRQKNTDAARRSRLRKVQKMDALENRVSELEKLNAGLLMRVAVLDSEKTNLKAKESSYEQRIRVLEEQLAEAHKALASRQ